MMPRPGVDFAMDIALLDSDRQAVANGITTVFHGVTWSWEPGLRGPENARTMLAGIERLRPRLGADTRFHLRHETFNLEAEPEILQWLSERRIDLVAFNDHMLIADETSPRSKKLGHDGRALGIDARGRSSTWSSASRAAATRCRLRSSGSRRPRSRTASRCSPMMTPAPTSAAGSARSDAGWRNFRPRWRPRRKPQRKATTSCSAPPMWCAAAAISAGSTPRTWWDAASARSWPRTITIRPRCWRRSVSRPRTSCRCMPPGRWSRRPPRRPRGSRIAAPLRAGDAPT